jgi:hypothetical protein
MIEMRFYSDDGTHLHLQYRQKIDTNIYAGLNNGIHLCPTWAWSEWVTVPAASTWNGFRYVDV